MCFNLRIATIVSVIFLTSSNLAYSNTQTKDSGSDDLPKLTIEEIKWVGGYRLPLSEVGDSRIAYTEGTFTLAKGASSIFVVGHSHHQAIAEMSVPKIKKDGDITKLNMANIVQPYKKVLNRSKTGNKDNLNRISGLEVINQQLWVNAIEFYDADANAKLTSLVVREPDNLEKSSIDGFFSLKGAAHASGWISKIPGTWQKQLLSDYITGYASNPSINSRLSIGPTAFTFSPYGVLDGALKSGFVSTNAILDFSLKTPLHSDRYNKSGENNLWTEISAAVYGFIVPGTQTYLVVGHSGGHKNGIGYKIKQNNGNECGGPCSKDHKDNYNYYWMWSVNDLVRVNQGTLKPHMPKPYEYGYFDKKRRSWKIIGADFDEKSRQLHILYESKDRKQSRYEAAPLMLVYQID